MRLSERRATNIGLLYPKVRNNIGGDIPVDVPPNQNIGGGCVPGIPGGVDASGLVYLNVFHCMLNIEDYFGIMCFLFSLIIPANDIHETGSSFFSTSHLGSVYHCFLFQTCSLTHVLSFLTCAFLSLYTFCMQRLASFRLYCDDLQLKLHFLCFVIVLSCGICTSIVWISEFLAGWQAILSP